MRVATAEPMARMPDVSCLATGARHVARRGRCSSEPSCHVVAGLTTRGGLHFVLAPSLLFDPLCLATLNTGILFVGPLSVTLLSDLPSPGRRCSAHRAARTDAHASALAECKHLRPGEGVGAVQKPATLKVWH
eukprot:366534-Chlamydomonas_euryale.AAC.9